MKLIIAEKNALAKQIIAAIGKPSQKVNNLTYKCDDYLITFLGGHALEHLSPADMDPVYKTWNLENLPIYFEKWRKRPKSDKKEVINNVKELLLRSDTVIHAGDMDDEGQLLVDEVLDYFHYSGKVLRLNTADTSPGKLSESLNNLKDNNRYPGYSAEARSLSDMIFGFNLSRFFSLKTGQRLIVGRVKLPTLGLVIERDKAISNFQANDYYSLYFSAVSEDRRTCKVKIELPKEDPLLDEYGYFSDKNKLNKLILDLKEKKFNAKVVKKTSSEKPPMPFNLATLQLLCEKKFCYSPTQVMEITQSLRDKYNAISYNRSECEYLPDSYFEEKGALIRRTLANLSQTDKRTEAFKEKADYKSSAFDSKKVNLHFAIVPQDVSVNISEFTEKERNVYQEICTRYLMQFCGDAQKEVKALTVDIGSSRKAFCNSFEYTDLAFLAMNSDRKISEEEKNIIPFDGDICITLTDPQIKAEKTKPPVRYTQATLIKDMCHISKYCKDEKIKALLLAKDEGKEGDKGSIGTSATRDTVISELIDVGYIQKEGKAITSTQKGKIFYDLLPSSAKGVDTTALWYGIQRDIETGNKKIEDLTMKVLSDCENIMNMKDFDFNQIGNVPQYAQKKLCKCSCSGIVYDTPKSYKCTSCKAIIFKDNKYFESLGLKITGSVAKKLFEKGCVKVKPVSKKTGKEYTATVRVAFDKETGFARFSMEF